MTHIPAPRSIDRVAPPARRAGAARWFALDALLVLGVLAVHAFWPVPEPNEPYYLAKARHFWEPQWLAGDFFLSTADSHWVFYALFGWPMLWLAPASYAWCGRWFTWFLLAIAWTRLSRAVVGAEQRTWSPLDAPSSCTLQGSERLEGCRDASIGTARVAAVAPVVGWAGLTAAAFVALNSWVSPAGEWVVGGFEAKSLAYVLVLWALAALVRDRWPSVWPLLGAATSLHVLVGGWSVLAAVLTWLSLGRERPTVASQLPYLALGTLLALPGLWPAVALSWGIDASLVQRAAEIHVYRRVSHHMLPQDFVPAQSALFLAVGGVWLAALWRGGVSGPTRRLARFAAAVAGLALVGGAIALVAHWQPAWAANWLRFYWFRLVDVVLPLACVFTLASWSQRQWFARPRAARGLVVLLLLVGGTHLVGLSVYRGFQPWARADAGKVADVTDWRDACAWIARETPPDARFLTPFRGHTFKWYAERSEVANWKETPQDAAAIVEWWQRMQSIYRRTEGGGRQWPVAELAELSTERVLELGRMYDAQFVLTVREPELALERAYENNSYVVYRLGDQRPIATEERLP